MNNTTYTAPQIYLDRHWKNRLSLQEARKLNTKRLLAYYKKHLGKRSAFLNNYIYQENDKEYNALFNTNPNQQFNEYLDSIKFILNQRENV